MQASLMANSRLGLMAIVSPLEASIGRIKKPPVRRRKAERRKVKLDFSLVEGNETGDTKGPPHHASSFCTE